MDIVDKINYFSEAKKEMRKCFACSSGIVGEEKRNGEIWECRCQNILTYHCYCPICGGNFIGSEFLASIFSDKKDLWLTNIIMHYRHVHRNWDSQWIYIQSHCKEGTYETEKIKVNNQIKRALLKNKEFMAFSISIGIRKNNFSSLKDNEEKTIVLINKIFERIENN